MDSVTQAMLGAAVGKATLGHRVGYRAPLWGAMLGTLPDLDVLYPFADPVSAFTWHRGPSHSVFVLAALTPLVVWLIRSLHPGTPEQRSGWVRLVLLVFGTHVLLDCFTVYGTQALWPLPAPPVGWATIFIIDPLYTLPLAAGVLAGLLLRRHPARAWRWNLAGLALSSLYLAWSAGAKLYADLPSAWPRSATRTPPLSFRSASAPSGTSGGCAGSGSGSRSLAGATMNLRHSLSSRSAAIAIGLYIAAALPALAGDVAITPLGSHDGELCRFDRAPILEDPDGTRLLYDAGRTVAGPEDPRLGKIDVVLVSHLHGDHVGDRRVARVNAGECAEPDTPLVSAPHTNSVEIALAKGARIFTGSEMPRFFAGKLQALGGDPGASQLVRFGGSHKVGGVSITTVPAVHSNGVAGALIGGELGDLLDAAGLTAYAGPPTGYVLTFSNGLVVYRSGDTGITAEQESVVRGHYGARVAVMSIGDTFTTGPTEAAYVVNELIKPAAVIASHVNEAATEGGKVIAGTKTDTFIKASAVPVHLPLSGRTMAFDSGGGCVSGC